MGRPKTGDDVLCDVNATTGPPAPYPAVTLTLTHAVASMGARNVKANGWS